MSAPLFYSGFCKKIKNLYFKDFPHTNNKFAFIFIHANSTQIMNYNFAIGLFNVEFEI